MLKSHPKEGISHAEYFLAFRKNANQREVWKNDLIFHIILLFKMQIIAMSINSNYRL